MAVGGPQLLKQPILAGNIYRPLTTRWRDSLTFSKIQLKILYCKQSLKVSIFIMQTNYTIRSKIM